MTLFLKHMARSIGKKPLQPIILVVTLMLSILTSTLALGIKDMLIENAQIKHEQGYGEADVTVTLNGTSKSRFMFAKRANELLGDRGEAVGAYELPLTYGENRKTVFGVAVELDKIENIFSFGFAEYGKITPSTLTDCALISERFAEKNGISLGDTLSVVALGEQKEYKVAAISRNRFMASYDVMVDVGGIVRILANDSLLVSAIGDGFKPSSTLYVNVSDGYTAAECIDILCADESFAEKTFNIVDDIAKINLSTKGVETPVRIAVLLCAILSAVITFSCLYIISSERIEENEIFAAAGAKRRVLNFMQYAEVLAYWLVGGLFAFALALPSTQLFTAYVKFDYARPKVAVSNLVLCECLILIISVATVTAFILAQKFRNGRGAHGRAQGAVAVVSAVIYIGVFTALNLVSARYRFPLYIITIISLAVTVFIGAPVLMKLFVGWLNRLLDWRFEKSFSVKRRELKYAVKNSDTVKMLYNTARLVTLFVVIILTYVAIILSHYANVNTAKNLFSADYAVFNATERCQEKLRQCPTLDATYNLYMSNAIQPDGTAVSAMSASDIAVFSDKLHITNRPSGDEVIISTGQAHMLDVGVGDKIKLQINGEEIELSVKEVVPSGFLMAVFDAEHFGIPYNMVMAKGKEGIDKADVIADISDKTAIELATVSSTADLMESKVNIVEVYLRAGDVLLVIITFFVTIGLINNLQDSYRARKEEFQLYRFAGMSRSEVRKMKLYEVCQVLLYGIVFGACGAVFSIIATNTGLNALGYETLINLSKHLGFMA